MNGHELIEKGIKHNDMDLIEEGYKLLRENSTKYTETPPVDLPQTPTESILDTDTDTDAEVPPVKPMTTRRSTDDFSMQIRSNVTSKENRIREDGGTNARSEPIDTKKVGAFNLFNDDLTDEKTDLKKNISKRSKGSKLYGQSTRKPQPTRLITVNCTDCRTEFEVAPLLVRNVDGERRFTCSNCIVRKGSNNYKGV